MAQLPYYSLPAEDWDTTNPKHVIRWDRSYDDIVVLRERLQVLSKLAGRTWWIKSYSPGWAALWTRTSYVHSKVLMTGDMPVAQIRTIVEWEIARRVA